MIRYLFLISFLLLSLTNRAFADIYKWTDEQGNVHATDDINQAPAEIQEKYKSKNIQTEPYVSKIPIRPPSYYYSPSPTPNRQVTRYWNDPETGHSYKMPINEYQIKKDRQTIREEKRQLEAIQAAAGTFFLLIILSIIVYICLWFWAFLDILKSKFAGNDKLVWWLTITMIPLLGIIAYITIGRKQRLIQEEKTQLP